MRKQVKPSGKQPKVREKKPKKKPSQKKVWQWVCRHCRHRHTFAVSVCEACHGPVGKEEVKSVPVDSISIGPRPRPRRQQSHYVCTRCGHDYGRLPISNCLVCNGTVRLSK